MHKKILMIAMIFTLLLVSCSGNGTGDFSEPPVAQGPYESTEPQDEDETATDEPAAAMTEGPSVPGTDGPVVSGSDAPEPADDSRVSNILIAYFTWADNTHVENEEEIDIDASTSASVLPPGNTGLLAGWIQDATGGDIFQIIVTEPYSSDYDECLDRAADEKAGNARPQLTAHVDNMDDYDIVFIGYPNWWYTAPMAVFSFLEEYDFSGKTVIPFCAHGTGGLSGSVNDITEILPGSEILEAFGVYRPYVESARNDINSWLDKLNVGE